MKKTQSPLYFDLTDIVEHALNNSTATGIQRTVLRIVEDVVRENRGRLVAGIIRHPLTGQFVLADLSFMRGSYNLGDLPSRFGVPAGMSRLYAGKLRQYQTQPLKRLFHAIRLRLQWAASPKLRAEIRSASQKALSSCLTGAKPLHGGVIVTLGAGWATGYAELHRFARMHGCKTVSLVHDLFPLSEAAFARDKNGRFRKWLDHAAAANSLLLCNSTATKKELEKYLRGIGAAPTVALTRFPHEFRCPPDDARQDIRDEVRGLVQRTYVLCVGRIEVRKNTLGLLRAWQELQNKRGAQTPLLVLGGKRGRGADEVYAFLRQTNNVNNTVTVAEEPGDAELELLYRHCQFTVFPSFLEGWGLPIGESLWFGKPVLCASNSSMPEAGGEYATYFDHDRPGSLLAALNGMLDHPVTLPAGIRLHLTTWSDTAASVCAAIDALDEPRQVVRAAPRRALHAAPGDAARRL